MPIHTYQKLLWASIAASVISTASSWFFYSRWNEVEDGHFDLLKKNTEISTAYSLLESSYDSTSRELSVLRDPNYKLIPLIGPTSINTEACRVCWNPYSRKTYFDALSLPSLPGDSVYQLWCKSGESYWKVASIAGDAAGGGLLMVGQVASAEQWQVCVASASDTLPPSSSSIKYSSGN